MHVALEVRNVLYMYMYMYAVTFAFIRVGAFNPLLISVVVRFAKSHVNVLERWQRTDTRRSWRNNELVMCNGCITTRTVSVFCVV